MKTMARTNYVKCLPTKKLWRSGKEHGSNEESAVNDAMKHYRGQMNPAVLIFYTRLHWHDTFTVRIRNRENFECFVFGADSFIEHYPELLTTGLTVHKESDGFFYVIKDEKIINDTCFFSGDEMRFLEVPVQ